MKTNIQRCDQIVLENNLNQHESQIQNHEERLEQIEATLGDPKHHITLDQASRISQAVKAIAMTLSERSGRNEYGGVYGELYRRFKIPSYRELPANEYENAMNFLSDWYQTLTDSTEIPF